MPSNNEIAQVIRLLTAWILLASNEIEGFSIEDRWEVLTKDELHTPVHVIRETS